MSQPLILHHYALSPFSEKIRLILGASGLPWHSLLVSPLPPRPATDPLTGGYRRIPVAQLGADLICDSELIAEEISALAQQPTLAPSASDRPAREFTAFAESSLFFDAVTSVPPRRALHQLRQHLSLWDTARFIWDRLGIARETGRREPLAQVARRFRQRLTDIEETLQGPYLFGNQPGHPDFALYHPLWFVVNVGGEPLPPRLPRLTQWYQQMSAFGHGQPRDIRGREALSLAAVSQPRPLPPTALDHPDIGKSVRITPGDYARVATLGTLAGVTEQRWILRRQTRRFDAVHVHFPRQGYHYKVA
ncbi:glutathione S-transferase family protein [Ferrimonas sediminicola]|uniref:Glutathione S-transferase family protein n=1 Tax=Ferrimonas sediminicola TaxID=2569538 RepID=A0A4U1BJ99_9GAMM|nr:glutathione S-transferase family protein [Ferrimonas sediminicola]TKB50619.1 glutathione S-transferase family protein [Ferrimonas sediminicola]